MADSTDAGTLRRRVIVRGRVQGVFFRDTVRRQAVAHGVSGWVRNLADGAVEAVFEGDAGGVAALVEFCHSGPPSARVSAVEIWEEQPAGLTSFSIKSLRNPFH